MDKCVKVIESDIAKLLPKCFGLMFDGWSKTSTQLVGVVAVGPELRNRSFLLGFSPLDEETDISAEEHKNYLEFIFLLVITALLMKNWLKLWIFL